MISRNNMIRALLVILLATLQVAAQEISRPTDPRQAAQSTKAWLRYLEARRLKAEGQAQRDVRLIEQAIAALREAVRLDPLAADPRVELGELSFLYLSKPDEATTEAMEAVRLEPENVGGHQLLARIAIARTREPGARAAEQVPKAILALEKVTRLDPRLAEGWALLADLWEVMGMRDKQIAALEKWAAAPPASDDSFYRWMTDSDLSPERALFRLSALYLQTGRPADALSAARRAWESNPDDEQFTDNLVAILGGLPTLADELQAYGQLLGDPAGPGLPSALLIGYGSALLRAGRDEEAAQALLEEVEADPQNVRARRLLATALSRSGRRSAAVDLLRKGMAAGSAELRRELQFELARTLEEMGLDAEALSQYERLFEWFLPAGRMTPANEPIFTEVVDRLTRLLRRVGNPAKLRATITRTRRVIDEQNPLLDLLNIDALREEGNRREALTVTRAAARRYPEFRQLLFIEATLIAETGAVPEATSLLEAALVGSAETAEADATIHQALAGIFVIGGDLSRAEEEARRARTLRPDDAGPALILASILQRRGRFADAESLLRQFLAREPANSAILNNLGYLLIESGTRYDEAQRLIERALAIEPINASYLDSLGQAAFRLGRTARAREAFDKALVYAPRNPTIHEHLGDLLASLGKPDEARRHWETALNLAVEADHIARLRAKLASQPGR